MTPPEGEGDLWVRRTIRAPARRLFDAWTTPEHLTRWFGPEGATCPEAAVDLRPGGQYRIGNRFSDGKTVWIVGEFELVEPPHKLVYSWTLEPGPAPARKERVTVEFRPAGEGTEVIIHHQWIPVELRPGHEGGWRDCLNGLERYLAASVW